jgi:hypothetical protein
MAACEKTVGLLQAAFSKREWEYLSQHGAFQYQLDKDDGSTRSYEDLVSVGNLLLCQYKDARDLLDEFGNKQD